MSKNYSTITTTLKKSKHLIMAAAIAFCTIISIPVKADQHYYTRPLRNGDIVYYDDSVTNWGSIKIYFFNSSDNSHPFEWSARPNMSSIGESNIFKFTIPNGYDIEGHGYDSIVFSSGTSSAQTVDVNFVGNGYAYKADSLNGSKYTGNWYLYDSNAVEPKNTTTIQAGDVIYYDNSITNWSNGVYIYFFGGTEPYSWNDRPSMTSIGNNMYEFVVPSEVNGTPIEDYNITHLLFSSKTPKVKSVDLGFIASGYAYKIEAVETINSKDVGSGYWYVYDKSDLQTLIDEASAYLSNLSCISSSDEYIALTQAITDANRAMNTEIPVEGNASALPGAFWNHVDTEIENLQNKLNALRATNSTCELSLGITKSVINPQTNYKIGDTVEFRIDITNNEAFPLSVTVSDNLNGSVFTASSTGDYTIISNQVAETRQIAAGETLSLFITYPITLDATNQYTNTAEITDASAIAAGYYLSNNVTASATFDTQSLNDAPVLTGINTNAAPFYILFTSSLIIITTKAVYNFRRKK